MALIELNNGSVTASVTTTAAMLLDVEFLVDGRAHRPFALAPWIGSTGLESLPGHLRVLGAEFVAVPFGSAAAADALPPAWQSFAGVAAPTRPHGRSADEEWTVVHSTENRVVLRLDYPEPEGVSALERTIALRPDAAAIDLTLRIESRRVLSTSVGLHPILRLPDAPGQLELDVEFDDGHCYPGAASSTAPTRSGATFARLDAVPAARGAALDLTRLPLGPAVDDVVLLAGVRGPLVARFADTQTSVRLDWDRAVLPHLMLWISDRGLIESPFSGRYRGLGTEPVAAAFDLPDDVSVASNPLTVAGHRTSVTVTPESPVTIAYSVEVSSLD